MLVITKRLSGLTKFSFFDRKWMGLRAACVMNIPSRFDMWLHRTIAGPRRGILSSPWKRTSVKLRIEVASTAIRKL